MSAVSSSPRKRSPAPASSTGEAEAIAEGAKSKRKRVKVAHDEANLTSYKLRIYPTSAQKSALSQWVGARRWVYNTGLYWLIWQYRLWVTQWKDENGVTRAGAPSAPSVDDFSRMLTWWKGYDPDQTENANETQNGSSANREGIPAASKAPSKPKANPIPCQLPDHEGTLETCDVRWLAEVPRTLISQSLNDLHQAYQNFFNPKLTAKFPKFQKNPSQDEDGNWIGRCRIQLDPRNIGWQRAWDQGQLAVPGLGVMKFRDARTLPTGKLKMLTLAKEASGAWTVSFMVVMTEAFASNTSLPKLTPFERATAVKRPFDSRKSKAQRFSHQDAAFGRAALLLEYKALRYGRAFLTCDRWDATSKTCSIPGCYHYLMDLAPGVRTWTCPSCDTEHDRDINAARNILAFALDPELAKRIREQQRQLRAAANAGVLSSGKLTTIGPSAIGHVTDVEGVGYDPDEASIQLSEADGSC